MKRRDFFKFLTVTPLGMKALLDQAIEEQSETSIEDDEPNEEMIGPPVGITSGSFAAFYHGTTSACTFLAERLGGSDGFPPAGIEIKGTDIPLNSLGIPITTEDDGGMTGTLKDDEWSGS